MKPFLSLLIILSVCVINNLEAHEGMLALYADQTLSSCQAELPALSRIDLSLYYIRGDGLHFGAACEFRIVKSSSGVDLLTPEFSPDQGVICTLGDIEGDYFVIAYENECSPDPDIFFVCTLPVLNVSDPDSFTVSVAPIISKHERLRGIHILECGNIENVVDVIGGTFVFNGECNTPDDPFGIPAGVENSSWGAIKLLLND